MLTPPLPSSHSSVIKLELLAKQMEPHGLAQAGPTRPTMVVFTVSQEMVTLFMDLTTQLVKFGDVMIMTFAMVSSFLISHTDMPPLQPSHTSWAAGDLAPLQPTASHARTPIALPAHLPMPGMLKP